MSYTNRTEFKCDAENCTTETVETAWATLPPGWGDSMFYVIDDEGHTFNQQFSWCPEHADAIDKLIAGNPQKHFIVRRGKVDSNG